MALSLVKILTYEQYHGYINNTYFDASQISATTGTLSEWCDRFYHWIEASSLSASQAARSILQSAGYTITSDTYGYDAIASVAHQHLAIREEYGDYWALVDEAFVYESLCGDTYSYKIDANASEYREGDAVEIRHDSSNTFYCYE